MTRLNYFSDKPEELSEAIAIWLDDILKLAKIELSQKALDEQCEALIEYFKGECDELRR